MTDVWGISANMSQQYYLEDIVPPVAEAGPDITVGLGRTFTLDGTGSSDNHRIATISWVLDPDGLNLKFHSSVVEFAIDELGVFPAIVFVVDFS
ncbi:MAG: hypothetical protein GWN18_01400, partial [Thermoplasmata archaeon]|nr:hypothetical protein [Thermoplasmata archaeon]NIS10653.1 hypothetical protein [Thermoplasmata archaeon]NIS18612.1 hypothetical protein [Thermoplasmata archaeon]NIT75603.1 hypothetical protein [Thermoplasmata archaeon]NIU47765.1 hypothetical protein [Thermoplasmata archaeon]